MPFVILPTNSASGGYNITNSLRFNSGSSDYLNRTPASAGNRKTWTWSGWVKLNGLNQYLFGASSDSWAANYSTVWINPSAQLRLELGGISGDIVSTNLFRDPSAWYHFVVAVDTTQATANNRVRMYVNGVEVAYTAQTMPAQNSDTMINSAQYHQISGRPSTNYLNGYLAEINLIDGQQLTPTSFGETDEDTGIWKPKAYTGTYGTNGFYLQFKNSASLGTDSSGNGNTFTVNNLTSIDQTTDTPTNNFCTLNPLNTGTGTLSEGNLKWVTSSSTGILTFGTIAIDMDLSNKFYCEMKLNSSAGVVFGIAPTTLRGIDTGRAGSYGYYTNGDKYSGVTASSYGASFTTNDIIGMLAGNGTLTFYKNGISQGTAFSGLTGTYIPFLAEVSCDVSMNFGNPPFTISSSETDPSGFGNFEYSTNGGYALNTKNLAQFG